MWFRLAHHRIRRRHPAHEGHSQPARRSGASSCSRACTWSSKGSPGARGAPAKSGSNRLVFIGRRLDGDKITGGFAAAWPPVRSIAPRGRTRSALRRGLAVYARCDSDEAEFPEGLGDRDGGPPCVKPGCPPIETAIMAIQKHARPGCSRSKTITKMLDFDTSQQSDENPNVVPLKRNRKHVVLHESGHPVTRDGPVSRRSDVLVPAFAELQSSHVLALFSVPDRPLPLADRLADRLAVCIWTCRARWLPTGTPLTFHPCHGLGLFLLWSLLPSIVASLFMSTIDHVAVGAETDRALLRIVCHTFAGFSQCILT